MQRYNASNTGLIHLSRDGDMCLWKDVEKLQTDIDRMAKERERMREENKQLKQGIIDDKDAEVVLVPQELHNYFTHLKAAVEEVIELMDEEPAKEILKEALQDKSGE